jgi:uncharacterized glyoxalase superfamily protein PhnB
MTGEARNLHGPSAFAAALDGAAVRLNDMLGRLLGAAQARFRPVQTAPHADRAGTPVIPTVRYRDVPKAVEWLCRAFGMQVHRVVTDAGGAPRYAELTIGSGMLMVAPIEDTPFGKLMVQPDEIGGVETQVCYLCVANARAHCKRAKAAGAVIVLDPEDEANRGRGYSCRDPEGHVWNFGTYDPWVGQSPVPPPARRLPGRVQQALATLFVLAVAGTLFSELIPQPSARAGTAAIAPPPTPAVSALDEPRPPEPTPAVARADAVALVEAQAHRAALAAAEQTAARARTELAEVRGALEQAEREAAAARSQLANLQSARLAAERAAEEARVHQAAIQKNAERAREEAAQERAKRIAADRAAARAARARRRATVDVMRTRTRWPRVWCYSPTAPNPAWSGPGRLNGFCKT